MERNIQEILLRYEAAPPEGLWTNIARELDALSEQHITNALLQHEVAAPEMAWAGITAQLDTLSEQHISTTLLQHEVSTPEDAWTGIAAQLDTLAEQHIADTLLQYETPAPVNSWSTIAATLDLQPISEKLARYEVAPPDFIWSKISTQLDAAHTPGKEPGKLVPMAGRRTFRFVAAAATIAAIVIGGIIFINNRGDNESIAATPAITAPVSTDTPATPATPAVPATTPADIASIAGVEAQPQPATAPRRIVADNRVTTAPDTEAVYGFLPPLSERAAEPLRTDLSSKIEWLKNSRGVIEHDISVYNAAGSYETIAGPNGMPVRVSQKVANLFRMISKADNPYKEEIDIIIEQSAFWKNKFRTWKETAANPAAIIGVFDLLEVATER